MFRRATGIVLLISILWWPQASQAQLGTTIVHDPISYVQILFTATRMLDLINVELRNLALLADVAQFLDVIQQSTVLIGQVQEMAQRLSGRAATWRLLADPAQIPGTAADLNMWTQQAVELTRQASLDAMEAQTLIQNTITILQQGQRLLRAVMTLIGSVQGLQAVNGLLAQSVEVLSVIGAQTASFQQAMTSGAVIQSITEQASQKIAQQRLSDWGTCQSCQ